MPLLDVASAASTHFARIHRAALILTGNPWDADDLAQETFLVAADRKSDFAGRSQVYTWLYGILLNLERRRRRSREIHNRKLKVLWDQNLPQAEQSPGADAPAEVAEWRAGLWGQVAQLPEGARQALVLRFSEHLSYEEIAQVLECPLGTVKSRIFNGLSALRGMLSDQALGEIPAHCFQVLSHVV